MSAVVRKRLNLQSTNNLKTMFKTHYYAAILFLLFPGFCELKAQKMSRPVFFPDHDVTLLHWGYTPSATGALQDYYIRFPDDLILTACPNGFYYGEPEFFGID